MRSTFFVALLLAGSLAVPALAAGDAALGEKDFNRCKSCHSITAPDGTTIQKGGKVGPNLYGVIGRQAGTYPDFRYGDSIVEAGNMGLIWDETSIAEYVQDPTKFLKTYLHDDKARGNMTFKLNSGMEDIAVYLHSVAPGI